MMTDAEKVQAVMEEFPGKQEPQEETCADQDANPKNSDKGCDDGSEPPKSNFDGEPPEPEPSVHPLARFIDIGSTPKPPRWVIPGFVGHGVTVIR